MRLAMLLAAVAGCASEPINAPDDCAAGELHVVQGSLDQRIAIANYAFVDAVGGRSKGTLDIGQLPNKIHVEFIKLAVDGETVDAKGNAHLDPGLDVGNCDSSNSLPGKLEVVGNSVWRFELTALRAIDYCAGAAVAEPLGGCYRGH